jgi:hypothetical protein
LTIDLLGSSLLEILHQIWDLIIVLLTLLNSLRSTLREGTTGLGITSQVVKTLRAKLIVDSRDELLNLLVLSNTSDNIGVGRNRSLD